jgi:hypothetical protein
MALDDFLEKPACLVDIRRRFLAGQPSVERTLAGLLSNSQRLARYRQAGPAL